MHGTPGLGQVSSGVFVIWFVHRNKVAEAEELLLDFV